MVDKAMANLSDQLMLVAVLMYLVAVLGYAAEIAFGGRRTGAAAARTGEAGAGGAEAAEPALATVAATDSAAAAQVTAPVEAGAAGHDTGGQTDQTDQGDEGDQAVQDAGGDDARPARSPAATADGETRIQWGRFAVMITVFAWAAHLAEIVTRGLAAHRLPWGNMYEFASAIVFAAVTTYLVVLARRPVRYLGVFVTLLSVLGLGVAAIWLYTDAGPVVPALRSYWIAIHVTLAITATGLLTLAAVSTVLYLVAGRYRLAWLPGQEALDRVAHQTIMFAFPIWTLAIMAGAVWADQAWGRYWGWDPKETWSFVTWVVYAGYLHARATAGWRGRRAAVVALIAYGTLLFNFFGVNFLISGLHSYAG